ncbi:Uncharacterised protein [Yersinia mollaretii]|uniref:hypothetical protein n=1 Tax=Yersinia mollaretii TaxID=33060 RepID=UPI0005E8F79C|nr:hypothetical protein [Yersinia mollaretii]CNK55679.1 Uncharacterised protein [Yersinia mollaretii]
MLKISNTILVSIALGFIITSFNAHAVKPISATMEQGASLAPLAMNTKDSSPPQFAVYAVRNSYQRVENNAQINFVISSDEYINYYAYVRKNNFTYGDASGFVNHRSIIVEILAKEVSLGDYELVIDVYNNDKLSANKTYNFKIVQ